MRKLTGSELPFYRNRPLPYGELCGRFLLTEEVLAQSRIALQSFADAGRADGGHEGLVFWGGIEREPWTIFTTVVIPDAEHSAQRVYVNERAYGDAVQLASEHGVAILAQVHSHPGVDARHSDGDDQLIILPFDGMLSIVVPNYGASWSSMDEAKVHQFSKQQWVLCTDESVGENLTVVPGCLDLRSGPKL